MLIKRRTVVGETADGRFVETNLKAGNIIELDMCHMYKSQKPKTLPKRGSVSGQVVDKFPDTLECRLKNPNNFNLSHLQNSN